MFTVKDLVVQLTQNDRGHIVIECLLIVAPDRILKLLHHDNDFLETFQGSVLGKQQFVVLPVSGMGGDVGNTDPVL